jgi:hypothetical protein
VVGDLLEGRPAGAGVRLRRRQVDVPLILCDRGQRRRDQICSLIAIAARQPVLMAVVFSTVAAPSMEPAFQRSSISDAPLAHLNCSLDP